MIGDIFDLVLLNPMVNILVVLTNLLWGSFGLAIIAFTVLVRILTFPLTLRQLQATRAMQELQPKVQEIQKKYSDPKRRQQELMALYREAGANPLGCLGPMLLQFPILIALFYSIRRTLPQSPEALEGLSGRLYDWSFIQHAVPLEEHFLGMDLRSPALIMVVLVGITSWLQTRTTVTTTTDERQRTQQQMMMYMMPLMFAFFALSFPSGVSLYWVVNSIVGIGFNIVTYGIPAFNIEPLVKVRKPRTAPEATMPAPSGGSRRQRRRGQDAGGDRTPPTRELRTANGPGRSKRQNRRRRS